MVRRARRQPHRRSRRPRDAHGRAAAAPARRARFGHQARATTSTAHACTYAAVRNYFSVAGVRSYLEAEPLHNSFAGGRRRFLAGSSQRGCQRSAYRYMATWAHRAVHTPSSTASISACCMRRTVPIDLISIYNASARGARVSAEREQAQTSAHERGERRRPAPGVRGLTRAPECPDPRRGAAAGRGRGRGTAARWQRRSCPRCGVRRRRSSSSVLTQAPGPARRRATRVVANRARTLIERRSNACALWPDQKVYCLALPSTVPPTGPTAVTRRAPAAARRATKTRHYCSSTRCHLRRLSHVASRTVRDCVYLAHHSQCLARRHAAAPRDRARRSAARRRTGSHGLR